MRGRNRMSSVMLATSLCITVAVATQAPPKNVLFMLIDDLGYADVGYHGNLVNATIPTPTIDELSAAGVRLEQYYVTQLCSPTRTSLMSGRYPYSIGMQDEVIVDGHPSCLPVNASTIADRLQAAGWATSAYGKWDLGMTSWGCTPTCRGFDHFFGFYNAFNDYFTHHVGVGLDFRNDTTPVKDMNGSYFTEIVTADAIRWAHSVQQKQPGQPMFSYLAHQSNHAPMEVPARYIARAGCASMPNVNPVRRMLCGMMSAVDDSLRNVTDAYKAMGLWETTVIIFSTDNGGNTDTGGNNYPLRGNKATTFEGGVRGVGWVGGGWTAVLRQATSRALIHGVSAWDAITTGSNSSRTEILLNLIPSGGSPNAPGQGAIRIGKWKLLHGHTCVWGQASPTYGCGSCAAHDGKCPEGAAWEQPLPCPGAGFSPPFCPNGWVPPPESGQQPRPPPDGPGTHCAGKPLPCDFPNSSLILGGTFLFDVESDPYEQHDLSASEPSIVAQLMARLQEFNATNIPQDSPGTDPASNPNNFGGVWTPWRGNPDPKACAAPPAPTPQPEGDFDGVTMTTTDCSAAGWSSGPGYSGPPMVVRVKIDNGATFNVNTTANIHRAIAGNHGFKVSIPCNLLQTGMHKVTAESLPPSGKWFTLNRSPECLDNGKRVKCPTQAPQVTGKCGDNLFFETTYNPPLV